MLDKVQKLQFVANYKRIWPYVKPYWFRALLTMVLSFPIGSLDAVIAWCMKPYLDAVLLKDAVGSATWHILFLIVGLTTCQGVLNYLNSYLNTWVGVNVTRNLKMALYEKLLSFETAYFDSRNSGDIVYFFNNDADLACAGLFSNLKTFLTRFFSSIALIFVLFANSWQLSIIAIVVLAITFYPMSKVRKIISSIVDQSNRSISMVITAYNETFAGNRTITAYNYQDYQKQKFKDIQAFLARLSIKMTQRTSWVSPVMHITASIGIAATIGYGAYLIQSQQITAGGFVAFITALLLLYTPLKNLGNTFTSVQVSFMAIERVFGILDSIPEIRDKENAIELDTVKDEIEFRHVQFGYNPNKLVLKDFNLKTKVGQCIALVGNSGGGKSTVVNLLPRFYDIKTGQILIDGTDIRDFSLSSLRNKMAVVFQDNFLFAGTIRENIQIGKPDATDEEIWKALDMAYLTDFVSSLKDGLDSQIGERGILLSGGQKQRIGIARAFIKDAQIIILDEATSALDNKAEAIVQKAIENLMKDRTVFVIAHRLSTIQNADKIVVLNEGEILEMGSHTELMKIENGVYKSLYNAQFKKTEQKEEEELAA